MKRRSVSWTLAFLLFLPTLPTTSFLPSAFVWAAAPQEQTFCSHLLGTPKRLGKWFAGYWKDLKATKGGRFFMIPDDHPHQEAIGGFLVRNPEAARFYRQPLSWAAQKMSRRMREGRYRISILNMLVDRPTRYLTGKLFKRSYRWTIPAYTVVTFPLFSVMISSWNASWAKAGSEMYQHDAAALLQSDYRFADLKGTPHADQQATIRYFQLRSFYQQEARLQKSPGFGQPPDYEELARYFQKEARSLDPSQTDAVPKGSAAEGADFRSPGSAHFLSRLTLLNEPALNELRSFLANTNRFPADKYDAPAEANRRLSLSSVEDLKTLDELIALEEMREWQWQVIEQIERKGDDPRGILGSSAPTESLDVVTAMKEEPVPRLLRELAEKKQITPQQEAYFWMENVDEHVWYQRLKLFRAIPVTVENGVRVQHQVEDFDFDLLGDVSAGTGISSNSLVQQMDSPKQ